jgi:hypothetical protein
VLLEAIDVRDVRVIERGQQTRLTLEPDQPIRVARERGGQDLDRDVAPEPAVAATVHLAHAARAEGRDDVVRTDASTDGKCHL